jgi:hypothetical protein
LEFYATWCTQLLRTHGEALRKEEPQLRAASKAIRGRKRTLLQLVDENDFALDFLANEQPPLNTSSQLAITQKAASS